jgi:hypothetical protein
MVAILVALLAAPCPVDGAPDASLEFKGGAWQLELRRGDSLLRRRLDLPEQDCRLAADTAALIVDRFAHALAPLRRRAPKPPVAPAQPPPPVIAQAAQNDAVRTIVVPEEPQRRVLMPEAAESTQDIAVVEQPRRWTFAVSAGAAGAIAGDDVRPGVFVDLTARSGRWAIGLSLATATGTADLNHRRGTIDGVELDSGLLALSAKPCLDLWVRACAGPFAGARVISGNSREESFVALQGEFGVALTLDRNIGNFNFAATLFAGATVGPLSHEALETAGSRFDATFALTLGYQVF